MKEIVVLEKELLGKIGNELYIILFFYVDYGCYIEVGENFYVNMDCIFLDVNKIIFGDNVMVGFCVSFYIVGYLIDLMIWIVELEFGMLIIVEDNVWIGGSVIILFGVIIGKNVIVVVGVVVIKDVFVNMIVGGNLVKVICKIDEND